MAFLVWPFAIAGAIGASIPLIIHFLNRERARRLVFSTVRFIQMSHQTNVQRHKLKRLLLLLMRILMLILLGFAFARPYFAQDAASAPELGGVRNVVIILDTSYSMLYGEVFETAKQEAIKRLEGLDNADTVALILSADKVKKVLPIDSERNHIKSAIENAEPTYYTTDYLDAIQTSQEILNSVAVGLKQIYLIGDLQKTGWDNFLDTDRLASDIDIEFVNVGVEQSKNLAITDINVPPVVLIEQKDTELVARIHNYGTENVEKLNVTLYIDDNKVESTEIDIEAESSYDAAFSMRIDLESKSVHTGWVEIESDELEIDNRQYFTVQSMKSIRVHCVNGEQRRAKIEDETFYLTKALQNTGGEGAPIIFTESTTIPTTDSIEQYDVIVLANLARIPSTEVERIKDYVNEGGTLLITVGDQVDSSGYQELLGSTDTSLMPCTLMQAVGDPIGKDEFQVIASVNYRHPIFATFSNPNHGDFGKGRFYRYFQTVPTPEASVIASFDDGNPALIEKMYGNGRVLCFTSTIDREWNDLPIHGVYLPFLHETIRYLAIAHGTDIPDYKVGDGIEYKGSKDKTGEEVAIFDPEKKEVRKTLNDQGNLFYENTDIPGIYSLHSSGDSPHYFVINVDSIESDLTTRNSEELTSMLIGSNEIERGPVEITPEVEREYHEGVEKNQGIATYILLAVFALAISEMFLANRV